MKKDHFPIYTDMLFTESRLKKGGVGDDSALYFRMYALSNAYLIPSLIYDKKRRSRPRVKGSAMAAS